MWQCYHKFCMFVLFIFFSFIMGICRCPFGSVCLVRSFLINLWVELSWDGRTFDEAKATETEKKNFIDTMHVRQDLKRVGMTGEEATACCRHTRRRMASECVCVWPNVSLIRGEQTQAVSQALIHHAWPMSASRLLILAPPQSGSFTQEPFPEARTCRALACCWASQGSPVLLMANQNQSRNWGAGWSLYAQQLNVV